MKKALNVIKTILVWLVIAAAVFMVVFTVISITTVDRNDRGLFGYQFFIVQTDSMSATDFSAGDVVITRSVDPATLREGDVITFISRNAESAGETLTHKIRALTTDDAGDPGFVTYGTTTDSNDAAVVTYPDVIGRYEFHLPGVGRFLMFLKTPVGYVVCIFIPLFLLLILRQVLNILRLSRKRKEELQQELEEQRQLQEQQEQSAEMLRQLQELRAQVAARQEPQPPEPAEEPQTPSADADQPQV